MTEKQILDRIYVSVTTARSDWKSKVKDLKKYKIKVFSLFLTAVGPKERRQIYAALEKIEVKQIPHVHLRNDMTEDEIEYLVKKYDVKAMTIHYQAIEKFRKSKYKKIMFVENNWRDYSHGAYPLIREFGGLCVDLSHLLCVMDTRPGNLVSTKYALEKYQVGCNHMSEIQLNGLSDHKLEKITELDYLAELPKKYFSRYLNIELTNSIKTQLACKKHIAKILAKAWK